jgi:hypothetical protein
MFLYPVLYRGYVFQPAGYQRSSMFVVPGTLLQKHAFRNTSQYPKISDDCFLPLHGHDLLHDHDHIGNQSFLTLILFRKMCRIRSGSHLL